MNCLLALSQTIQDRQITTDVNPHDVIMVHKGFFAKGVVVIIVEPQRLPQEVEAMQMVESFNIGWESVAVLVWDLDHGWAKSCF